MKKIIIVLLLCFSLIFLGEVTVANALDIYVPLCFCCLAEQESLVEFTVVSATRVDGVPEGSGWSADYHYELVLHIDNVVMQLNNTWPLEGSEVTTIIHYTSPLDEGQQYLTFLNQHELDGRLIAKINPDRTITAIAGGVYFVEYNGYTVEQVKDRVETMLQTGECDAAEIMELWERMFPEDSYGTLVIHPEDDILDFEVLDGMIFECEAGFGDVLDFEVLNGVIVGYEDNIIRIPMDLLIGIIVMAVCMNVVIILVIRHCLKRRYANRSE